MIKPAGLLMAVVMAGVTAGTYYGLEMLPPGTIPPPFGRVPPQAPPPVTETASPEPEATIASSAPSSAPAPQAEASHAPPTEQDLAEEPPQQATPTTPQPKTEPAPATAEAKAPATPPEAKAEPAPAPQAQAETAQAPAPAPPKTKAKTSSKPAAEKSPAGKPAEKSAKVAKAETTGAQPTPTKAEPPDADALKPWWPDASKMPANQLKLMYAGQVKGEEAVALLFSAPLALDTVKQYAQIKSEAGDAAAGNWELGKNPRLAVFRGLKPGRYTVILQPEVADDKGFMLGTTLKGPVYVQVPETQN